MGKYHDALEKIGRRQGLEVVSHGPSKSVEIKPVQPPPTTAAKDEVRRDAATDQSRVRAASDQPLKKDATAQTPAVAASNQALKDAAEDRSPVNAMVDQPLVSASVDQAPVDQRTDNPPELDPNLVVYHDPLSMEAEIFKVLRNNILFPKEGSPPPSIMVTSPTPGDGKSFVAANLAISIARGVEEHVLLMDCDMRRSSIHRKFGFDDDLPGLSEHLSKGIPLPSLLKKTVVDKLTILPGGRTPENPSELLSSQVMKELLEQAKNRYHDRYIVVDSPPPLLTAETTALANYIDGIVIVVRYGKTPKKLVEELIKKIGREKIIGVVFNGYQKPTTERYGYGRYEVYQYGKKKA